MTSIDPKKKKRLKTWRLPKIEDSMERWSASPYVGQKGREDFWQTIWD
jgi:hypothetical protein